MNNDRDIEDMMTAKHIINEKNIYLMHKIGRLDVQQHTTQNIPVKTVYKWLHNKNCDKVYYNASTL